MAIQQVNDFSGIVLHQSKRTQSSTTESTIPFSLLDLYEKIHRITHYLMQVASTPFPIGDAPSRLDWIQKQETLVIDLLRHSNLPNKRSISKACFYIQAPLQSLIVFQRAFSHRMFVVLPTNTRQFVENALGEVLPIKTQALKTGIFGNIDIVEVGKETFVCKSSSNRDPSALECLHIETCLLMTFNHPNIICMRAASYDGIFLEVAKNENLQTTLQSPDLDTEQVQQYILDIIEGLSHIHEKGFTYKDLKPENILIFEGRAKLCDFGLTVPTKEDHQLSGTAFYLPPEAIHNIPSQQSDIWALGVLIFKVITGGKLPYPTQRSTADSSQSESREEYLSRVSQIAFSQPCNEKLIFTAVDEDPTVAALMKKRDPKGIFRSLIIECLHGDRKQRPSLAQIKEKLLSSDPMMDLHLELLTLFDSD